MSGLGAGGDSQIPDFLQATMFARRTIAITGHLDEMKAGDAAAALLTLDAMGDERVELRLDCPTATLDAALTLIDTIDVLGVPTAVTCVGSVGGAAVGVLAVGHHRSINRHGRVHLTEPRIESMGRASDLERWAAHQQERLRLFQQRLAEATGRPFEHIEADMQRGRYLDAEEAIAYGLVDDIMTSMRRSP